jgi:hypothetical protein
MKTLRLVAERDGPEMMAWIGMMRALKRHCAKADPALRQNRARTYRGHSAIQSAVHFF